MNKEQLLELIEDTDNELKNELANTTIDKRTRILNLEYLLGKRTGLLRILKIVDIDKFCDRANENEFCKQAFIETGKIYSI